MNWTRGTFLGMSSSNNSSVIFVWDSKIWDFNARVTDAFTCVDVDTSELGSNFLNMAQSVCVCVCVCVCYFQRRIIMEGL